MDRNVLSAAFHVTIPVLMGYLAIGMAFGLMMDSAGYNVFWALLMSLIIYAGAGQYLGVTLLAAGASPLQTALMTLLLNFRHMFYGPVSYTHLDVYKRQVRRSRPPSPGMTRHRPLRTGKGPMRSRSRTGRKAEDRGGAEPPRFFQDRQRGREKV